jgi:adenosylmethionine-8-amino-7-oxononanoate aminotransferase
VADFGELDKRYVWHPFTQMKEWNRGEPLVIERGEGAYLIDSAGKAYLDGVSSLWVTVHGHNRREINDAIKAQLDRVAHSTLLGLTSPPAVQLAERLVKLAPSGLTKVFYSDSGATAVEIALKQAFQYWQHVGRPEKTRFIYLENAYHGDTLGAVAVGGIDTFHKVFAPLLPHGDDQTFCMPGPLHGADRSLAALEDLLHRRASEVAALIIEPLVQGAAGMLVQPPGYLPRLAELCRKHEVLLIADEVATGFGRTGTMFACEHEQVQPDLLCLAKGITGGYLPLAATLSTDRIYEAFLGERIEQRTFYHGHSYTGNALGCAAAIASLDLFESDRVLENVAARAGQISALLERQVRPLPAVREIRQKGLMIGIELGAAGRPVPPTEGLGMKVCMAVRRHGVILRPLGDVIVLMPPLCISEQEAELLVTATSKAIEETT